MNPTGLVLVLNGTSSAGKSTLARALQERWEGPLLDAGLDRHLEMLPRRYMAAAWPEVYRYDYAADGSIAGIGMGPVGTRLYRAMHRVLAAVARSGSDVVADHVLLDSASARDLAEALDGVRAVLVGVRLEEPDLSRRQAERADRTLGQATAQLSAVHAHGPYDLEVDTARQDPDAAAAAVLAWLEGGRPTALDRIRAGRQQPGPDRSPSSDAGPSPRSQVRGRVAPWIAPP